MKPERETKNTLGLIDSETSIGTKILIHFKLVVKNKSSTCFDRSSSKDKDNNSGLGLGRLGDY